MVGLAFPVEVLGTLGAVPEAWLLPVPEVKSFLRLAGGSLASGCGFGGFIWMILRDRVGGEGRENWVPFLVEADVGFPVPLGELGLVVKAVEVPRGGERGACPLTACIAGDGRPMLVSIEGVRDWPLGIMSIDDAGVGRAGALGILSAGAPDALESVVNIYGDSVDTEMEARCEKNSCTARTPYKGKERDAIENFRSERERKGRSALPTGGCRLTVRISQYVRKGEQEAEILSQPAYITLERRHQHPQSQWESVACLFQRLS